MRVSFKRSLTREPEGVYETLLGNEALIEVSKEDTILELVRILHEVCSRVDKLVCNAPIHPWHGRPAVYVTIQGDWTLEFKKSLVQEIEKHNFNKGSGTLWRDLQAEHGLDIRIQLVYAQHSTIIRRRPLSPLDILRRRIEY